MKENKYEYPISENPKRINTITKFAVKSVKMLPFYPNTNIKIKQKVKGMQKTMRSNAQFPIQYGNGLVPLTFVRYLNLFYLSRTKLPQYVEVLKIKAQIIKYCITNSLSLRNNA